MILIPRNISPYDKKYYYFSPITWGTAYYYLIYFPDLNIVKLSYAPKEALQSTLNFWERFGYTPKVLKEFQ